MGAFLDMIFRFEIIVSKSDITTTLLVSHYIFPIKVLSSALVIAWFHSFKNTINCEEMVTKILCPDAIHNKIQQFAKF